jgi:hypothetical protein
VVKTDVHFPTDISLLYDAMRVLLHLGNRFGSATYVMPPVFWFGYSGR